MSETLVHVKRGSLVESLHRGDVVVVDRNGNVLWFAGDPQRIAYVRSSAKPFQALPLVESGAAEAFGMSDAEIALCCASHNGEPMHAEPLRALLVRAGLRETDLQCGIHTPSRRTAYDDLLRQGVEIDAIYNNCSGKHIGMLILAKFLGADITTYLRPDHPVQQLILTAIAEVCEYPPKEILIGIDGCSAPTFGLPIVNFAHGFAKFPNPETGNISRGRAQAMKRIAMAMTKYPELVGGTDRSVTLLMQRSQGRLVGKDGAEGVYAGGLVDQGWGMCVKVDDGNSRGTDSTVVDTLRQIRALPAHVLAALESIRQPKLINHRGTVVGEVEPVFQLRSAHLNCTHSTD